MDNNLIVILAMIVVLPYIFLVAMFYTGWKRGEYRKLRPRTQLPFVSVVIAFRNEQEKLPRLLSYLSDLQFPNGKFEIILSDDFSIDNGKEIIEKFILNKNQFKLIIPDEQALKGKKGALSRAILQASGEIIITTDADCSMGKQWLVSMGKVFTEEINFVIGPVEIKTNNGGVFARMQALEFLSLSASTGGSAGWGMPVLCNGANLAFRKKGWEEVVEKVRGKDSPSGDDVFLLHAFKKRFPGSIVYLHDQEAIIQTGASKTLMKFLRQRIRWAGKSGKFSDPFTLISGSVVAMMNLLITVLLVTSFFWSAGWVFSAVVWGIKSAADFGLLARAGKFFSNRKLLWLYPLVALVYPIYVFVTLILAAILPKAKRDHFR